MENPKPALRLSSTIEAFFYPGVDCARFRSLDRRTVYCNAWCWLDTWLRGEMGG